MDEATALARLKSMTAWDVVPTLSEDELNALLAQFLVQDTNGAFPSDVGYVDTWNLNGAAAQGWLNKGAKASGDFDFGSDVNTFDRSQVFAHCQAMYERYARRASQTLDLQYGNNYDPVIGNLGG